MVFHGIRTSPLYGILARETWPTERPWRVGKDVVSKIPHHLLRISAPPYGPFCDSVMADSCGFLAVSGIMTARKKSCASAQPTCPTILSLEKKG